MTKILPSSEFGFIRRIRDKFSGLVPPGTLGIGDDCAVVPLDGGRSMAISTDLLVEEVHFLRNRISPRELGSKSLAVNLSDIAAMGATPSGSLLSLGLSRDLSPEWREEFVEGYREMSERYRVPLLGGDTTASEKIVISVTAMGTAPDDRIKTRSGARPGDRIFVTGPLGDSAAGLRILLDGGTGNDPGESKLVQAHKGPRPRVGEGIFLGSLPFVRAMMDVSDGVASDLLHILEASGVGAWVDADRLPISAELLRFCRARGSDAFEMAATGGEDYALLFTVEPAEAAGMKSLFYEKFGYRPEEIGSITDGPSKIQWFQNGRPARKNWKGFAHF